MQTILVASDLSDRSERALRRAYSIAEQQRARLTVLCVVDADLPQTMAANMKAGAEAELQRLCASVSDYPASLCVEIGDPKTQIHAHADACDADLIVLGVHRQRFFADMFSGTTMERLVRSSRRPVLLVRDPVYGPYQRPVCGLDLSPSCVAAAQACAALAPQAEITAFHAVHVPFRGFLAPGETSAELQVFVDEAAASLSAWLATAELPAQCKAPKVVPGGVTQALYQTIRDADADLACIGAHGRPSLSPSYLGGVTEDLLRSPPCDLLVVRR